MGVYAHTPPRVNRRRMSAVFSLKLRFCNGAWRALVLFRKSMELSENNVEINDLHRNISRYFRDVFGCGFFCMRPRAQTAGPVPPRLRPAPRSLPIQSDT